MPRLNSLQDEYAIAVLKFDYPQGLTVNGSLQPSPMVKHSIDGQWQTLQRDLETESAFWAKLKVWVWRVFRNACQK